jgi:serine protease Do
LKIFKRELATKLASSRGWRQRIILTANHVVSGAEEIMIGLGTELRKYKAKKVGTDPGTDVALLKIEEKNLPAMAFADSDKARVGDIVLAIGNPFGLRQTVTMGIISAVGRGGIGIVDYENFIQTDAAINMGNSAARWSISKASC